MFCKLPSSRWFAWSRQFCCDGVATDGTEEDRRNGIWVGIDAGHADAHASVNRGFAQLSSKRKRAEGERLLSDPSDLAIGLAIGLPRLGFDLPRVALDPCGGDGELRRCLAAFGLDVRLSDLYPEMYSAADGYLTGQALDA
jgi:hypothetical protein